MKRLVIFALASGLVWAISGTAYGKIIPVPSPAYPTIQAGINAASPGDTVQVAPGTYHENIEMKSGVVIQGAGAGDDPSIHSIIDGGGNGSVVTANGVDSIAKLDGFTIRNGYADYDHGGGMHNSEASPIVSNCVFFKNSAGGNGGGMYNTDSSPTVINCTFMENSAQTYGGGMSNFDSSPTVANCTFAFNTAGDVGGIGGGMNNWRSSSTVTNCVFVGNSAYSRGGGMSNWYGSSLTVTNCYFVRNSTDADGGGMENYHSHPTVTDCTFSENSSGEEGGGMYNYQSSPTVTNCTFSLNTAVQDGGGMFNYVDSSPTVTDCTFSENSSGEWGGGMHNQFSYPAVTNCTFLENSSGERGGGICNINSDPTVSNCHFLGNGSGTDGGGIYNGSSFPTVTDCTFQGNLALYGGGMYNLWSYPVVTNCTFSLNTAVNYGGGMLNFYLSSPTVTNCIFAVNRAFAGGGVFNSNSDPTVTNCTFFGNVADYSGGGMADYYSSPTVTNCILWGDNPNEIFNVEGSTPSVTYSNIQGGYPGTGNINADPLFVNVTTGDFHLQQGSPCIDAGTNGAPELPDADFEGDPRVVDGDKNGTATVDMGADEHYVGQPVPDIKANGSDGPVTIPQGENLIVTVALDPGSHDGENADWWVTAKTPFGRYWYTSDRRWVESDTPVRAHGGPLFDLSPYEVLNTSDLPVGAYTFHFGVDLLMNGSLDQPVLSYDSVGVTIE